MLLSEVLKIKEHLDNDPNVVGITADSRRVKAGYIFAALPGSVTDGRKFIPQALSNGAVAILTDRHYAEVIDAVCIQVDDPRRELAFAAQKLAGPVPDMVAAVTGTNGKTSVAHFLRQIWQACGYSSASLGTLGVVTADGARDIHYTTPDPEIMHEELSALVAHGVDHVVLEASSHGLDQRRLDAVGVQVGGFTNLTRDHLDYHKDFETYLAAKLGLVTRAIKDGGSIVLNADSDVFGAFKKAADARGLRVISYGESGTDLKLLDARPHSGGQHLEFEYSGNSFVLDLPLVGTFQSANILCALGMAVASGLEMDQAVQGLHDISNVPGRMELMGKSNAGSNVYVDYAHTPDALKTVLEAARPHTSGRLIVVFGCGGDRDKGKRPEMGKIAANSADIAIVTDDNPRSEDASVIRSEIMIACPEALEIGDRRSAITEAIRVGKEGDLILVAGKGHEEGQVVKGETLPFSDRDVCKELLGGTQ
ncbi:UDP-N-acetylmuramoyl-L-alanyl-D-glutamate--2,6-diaminopimelate ligase [Sneathiella sp. P13V-1]|uniref:UDP-N-acetylmuramoyl-L-alanyl-D-glutamate--2, 6-diaminopimelate ligase n=1 Tax=Sneathiella sp. P13V-1 TaxID=2697366 RepID=UPI00187B5605|nr:UDP-N-acetylmuramoyl-L-alanyl-D-glutamate--2,6-diaminopimelate ligase [Sneathiella sp. P13V-1]MBE7636680.1 UDP-N-acetylmuramoyl-L-alanyl-D-glutamate--2,6-diaminopimelate ligase [Sneathiella sp. P13V-1]